MVDVQGMHAKEDGKYFGRSIQLRTGVAVCRDECTYGLATVAFIGNCSFVAYGEWHTGWRICECNCCKQYARPLGKLTCHAKMWTMGFTGVAAFWILSWKAFSVAALAELWLSFGRIVKAGASVHLNIELTLGPS